MGLMGSNSGRVGPLILYFLFNFLTSLLTPGVKTYYSVPTPKKK